MYFLLRQLRVQQCIGLRYLCSEKSGKNKNIVLNKTVKVDSDFKKDVASSIDEISSLLSKSKSQIKSDLLGVMSTIYASKISSPQLTVNSDKINVPNMSDSNSNTFYKTIYEMSGDNLFSDMAANIKSLQDSSNPDVVSSSEFESTSSSESEHDNFENTNSSDLQYLAKSNYKTAVKSPISVDFSINAVDSDLFGDLKSNIKFYKDLNVEIHDLDVNQLDFQESNKVKLTSRSLCDGYERLNIFNNKNIAKDLEKEHNYTLSIFDAAYSTYMKSFLNLSSVNMFEEMIHWTNDKKMWHFPINNEQDFSSEVGVEFYDHVFLEQHLIGFPKIGPIRKFMELVCIGLSKNYTFTVSEKIEYINWFRHYFEDKLKLIDDALQEAKKQQTLEEEIRSSAQ